MSNSEMRVFLYGSKGQQVTLSAGQFSGFNVAIHGKPGVTTFNEEYFADVLTALVMGEDHVAGLPGYCQCEECRGHRGKAFAERLAAAQAERLRKTQAAHDAGYVYPDSTGHDFKPTTDNPVICQLCGGHQGNHHDLF